MHLCADELRWFAFLLPAALWLLAEMRHALRCAAARCRRLLCRRKEVA